MGDRIMRIPETVKITGRSKSSLLRDEKLGTFPQRRKIGRYAVGYLESEVNMWLQKLQEADKSNV